MSTPTITTAEELLDLREPGYRHELVRGELRRMSPAGHWHGSVGMVLAARLSLHVQKHGLGAVYLAETGFVLARNPDTVCAPDVAFVQRHRLPRAFTRGYFPGAPDLAVEVTSPNDTFTEVNDKALRWLEHGTRVVWVIDPVALRATIYHRARSLQVVDGDGMLLGDDVVPGLSIALRELWPDDQP